MYFSSIGPIKKSDRKRPAKVPYTSDRYYSKNNQVTPILLCVPPPKGETTYFAINIPYIITRTKNISHLIKEATFQ